MHPTPQTVKYLGMVISQHVKVKSFMYPVLDISNKSGTFEESEN